MLAILVICTIRNQNIGANLHRQKCGYTHGGVRSHGIQGVCNAKLAEINGVYFQQAAPEHKSFLVLYATLIEQYHVRVLHKTYLCLMKYDQASHLAYIERIGPHVFLQHKELIPHPAALGP